MMPLLFWKSSVSLLNENKTNENDLDFNCVCRCPDELYNTESDETVFFLCIGYGDKSYHDSKEPKPEMKDVIKWM